MVYSIPKYTQYQLSEMLIEEVEKRNMNIIEFSSQYKVDSNLLEDILQGNVKFKAKHYEVVSNILGMSIDELLADEIIAPISFRSIHEEDDQYINQEIKKISDFFVEVALLKKINGGTNVEN